MIANGVLNDIGLLRETDYIRTMNETVMPYLEERAEKHTVQGRGGAPLDPFGQIEYNRKARIRRGKP